MIVGVCKRTGAGEPGNMVHFLSDAFQKPSENKRAPRGYFQRVLSADLRIFARNAARWRQEDFKILRARLAEAENYGSQASKFGI